MSRSAHPGPTHVPGHLPAVGGPPARRRTPARLAVAVGIGTLLSALLTAPIVVAADAPASVTIPVLSPDPAISGVAVTVTAAATDDVAVSSAEVSLDGGAWTAMNATDGTFDGTSEGLTASVGGSVLQVAAGDGHTCALLADTTVRCWGDNEFGQLGDGTGRTDTMSVIPVRVAGLSGVTAITASSNHTCALLADTTVRCWGYNVNGELGDGMTTNRLSPVAVSGLSGVTAIAAGYYQTCAITSVGGVECWGAGVFGELGDGTTTNRPTPVTVTGLSGVTAITAGFYHTCAVLADTTVRCWGRMISNAGYVDQLSPVAIAGLSGVTALVAGWSFTCARLDDATVRCWGENYYGQLGNGTTTTSSSPVAVAGLSSVTEIAASGDSTCALVTDTTVRCWGDNEHGQLGDGTVTNRLRPVAVTGPSGATAIAAGWAHTCAILAGTSTIVRCWGANYLGQLGKGTSGDGLTAAAVKGLSGLDALAAGTHGVCVRATDNVGSTSDGTACATFTVTADVTPPTVVAPTARLYSSTTLGATTTPVHMGWSATDPSGVASYTFQRQVNGGAWGAVGLATTTTTSINQSLAIGTTYRYRVMATDTKGNASAWIYGRTMRAYRTQESSSSVTYRGTWHPVYTSAASGGSLRYASGARAYANYKFAGSSIAWVAYKGRTRGSAKVYLDGVYKATVSLYATSNHARPVVYAYNWGSVGTHMIKIVVVGTSGHPRVDLDAFVRLYVY